MNDLLQQLSGVLLHGDVHLHLDSERNAVGAPRICTVLRRSLGDLADLSLQLDLFDELFESLSLDSELLAEAIERGLRQFPDHRASNSRPGI